MNNETLTQEDAIFLLESMKEKKQIIKNGKRRCKMGFFEKSKTDKLLLRLFGYSCADCMNLGSGEGLLTQIRSAISERIDRVDVKIRELDAKITALEKQKAKKKVVKKKR